MEDALFGGRYQEATARLDLLTDPIEQIVATATVARAVYENEAAELGLIRGAWAFSPALRKMEQAFEGGALRASTSARRAPLRGGQGEEGPAPISKARRLLWMYSSRDVYRLLVQEGGWSPEDYEQWLADTLAAALVGAPIVRTGQTEP